MRKPITVKQKVVLDFIVEFTSVYGFSPTIQEIADFLGKSKSTAKHFVDLLVWNGLVEVHRYEHRSIRVVK